MLATDGSDSDLSYPLALEPKYDGVRALAVIDDDVRLFTRTGHSLDHLEGLRKKLSALIGTERFVLDGELVGNSFEDSVSKASKKGVDSSEDLTFFVFDIVPLDEFNAGRSTAGYLERRRRRRSMSKNANANSISTR
jgi:ATP-dependent DNA ligase